MTAQLDANTFLMGGGIPSAQFPNQAFGTTVGGQITVQPEVSQQTDLDTSEPKFWNDGKPMMQLVVTVQTDLRDPAVDDDDGQRKFYVKAKLLDAVRAAVRTSGAKGLEVGGTLAITYIADGEVKKRGHNPPKIYTATYTRPAAAQANQFLQGAPAQPQYAPPVAQPAYVPPAPAAPAYVPPAPAPAAPVAQAAPVAAPAGVDPATAAAIANLTPAQRAQLGLPA